MSGSESSVLLAANKAKLLAAFLFFSPAPGSISEEKLFASALVLLFTFLSRAHCLALALALAIALALALAHHTPALALTSSSGGTCYTF